MVTPLSIAYHRGEQYRLCREAMSRNGGRWEFTFFDREPHALFGEDVKTRNAILLRMESHEHPPRGEKATVSTSGLQRWTSRGRADLLGAIQLANLGPAGIRYGIPKLGSAIEVEAYRQLQGHPHTLRSLCADIGSCSLASVARQATDRTVFVGGTAYSFLNAFFGEAYPVAAGDLLSTSPVHQLSFQTDVDALVAYALLSSRLVFWLWYVDEDGFHVTRRFLQGVPIGRGTFQKDQVLRLAELGADLWSAVRRFPMRSVNSGRVTYSFSPLACECQRKEIDTLLVASSLVPKSFDRILLQLMEKVIVTQ